MKSVRLFLLALVVSLLSMLVFVKPAAAHGHVDVGEYELVIGFHVEPAYQGEPNGLDLFVTHHETGEPVNGLEETLQAEIIFGSATQELEIRAQWGEEGAYTAYVLPTEAGDYTWHIWGDIEGTPVDVEMTSSPDTFSAVKAKSLVSFPNAEPSSAELLETVDAAASRASTALIIGVLGLVVGVVGIVMGVMGMRAARR